MLERAGPGREGLGPAPASTGPSVWPVGLLAPCNGPTTAGAPVDVLERARPGHEGLGPRRLSAGHGKAGALELVDAVAVLAVDHLPALVRVW